MKKEILPFKTEKEIYDLLSRRRLEDLESLQDIEVFFQKKRGYVFKMPKEGSSVILMLSGGLDSVIMWDILMRKYKLKVFPFYLRRGQIRMPFEEKAIRKFSQFNKKLFSNLFVEPQICNEFIPPLEFRFNVTQHAEVGVDKKTGQWLGVPMYGSLMTDFAVNYAVFLEYVKKEKVRDIFFGFMEKDGERMKYETLTFLRLASYNVCNTMSDFSWQISSLALEKEMGFFFDKDVLVKWAKRYDLPISETFSCIKLSYYHCGECLYCQNRKKAFRKAEIEDKTVYLSNLPKVKLMSFLAKPFIMIEYAKMLFSMNLNIIKHLIKYINSVYKS